MFGQLDAFARERLAAFKVPRRWERLPALPRNDRGKLVRRTPRLYDRAVSEGKILVGVENPSCDTRAIEAALRPGATEVKRAS